MSLILPDKDEKTIITCKDGLTLEILAVARNPEHGDAVLVRIAIGEDEAQLMSLPVGSTLKSDLTMTIGG